MSWSSVGVPGACETPCLAGLRQTQHVPATQRAEAAAAQAARHLLCHAQSQKVTQHARLHGCDIAVRTDDAVLG